MEFENEMFFKKYEQLTKKEINTLFITACVSGQAEHARFFLTSPHLKTHADIHAENDIGFILAVQNGLLEHSGHLVRKLIKEHYIADPNYENLLKYLILDAEISKTTHISDFLNDIPSRHKNHNLIEMVNKFFSIMEMKDKLNNNLEIHKSLTELINKI